MYVISDRNLHKALPHIAELIIGVGYEPREESTAASQYAKIIRLPEPLTVEIEKPCERVIFHRDVEINPFTFFFAGMETMFVNMKGDSKQGTTGMKEFGKILREDRLGRPINIPMRNAVVAFQRGKDRRLNAYVSSTDINPVQDTVIISMMQEVVAKMAGCDVGTFTWISSNILIDEEMLEPFTKLSKEVGKDDPYSTGEVEPHTMATISISKWVREMDTFSKQAHKGSYVDPFFSNIVVPIHQAGVSVQQSMWGMAQQQISACYASDWKKAASDFIVRRSLEMP